MYRERFEIEKEQRLQNRVMGGCIVGIILFLALIITCWGCSSHKNVTATSATSIADSCQIDAVAYGHKRELSWDWLQTLCDSINVRLTADSIVTHGGAVIHRPVLDCVASRPQTLGMSVSEASEEEASVSHLSANSAAETRSAISGEEDSVTVYKPPASSASMWIATAVAVLFISFVTLKLYRKWKRRQI